MVYPELTKTHVEHAGASHTTPRVRKETRSTSAMASAMPGEEFRSIDRPSILISQGTHVYPDLRR
eukprot:4244173-Alexandrium_andersonii.AAC.1